MEKRQKKIIIPDSNLIKFIFPYVKGVNGGFMKSEGFSAGKLLNRATEQDINRVLDSLKQSPYYKRTKTQGCLWTLYWLVFAFFMGDMLFCIRVADQSKSNEIRYQEVKDDLVITLGVIFICLCLVVGITHWIGERGQKYTKERASDLEERLRKFNEVEFRSKGLSWSIGEEGEWIQLNLDFLIEAIQGSVAAGKGLPEGILYHSLSSQGLIGGGIGQGVSFDNSINDSLAADPGNGFDSKQVPLTPKARQRQSLDQIKALIFTS